MSMARSIAQQMSKKNKRNPIVDTFIEVLKEDPDIEILNITSSNVSWRFKVDSPPVIEIAGEISSFDEMTKEERRKYRKLEEKYQKKAMKETKDRMGMGKIVDTIMDGVQ